MDVSTIWQDRPCSRQPRTAISSRNKQLIHANQKIMTRGPSTDCNRDATEEENLSSATQ
jgi:hypothetical protein